MANKLKVNNDDEVKLKFSYEAWDALQTIKDSIAATHQTKLNLSNYSEAEKNKYRGLIDALAGEDFDPSGNLVHIHTAKTLLPTLLVGRENAVEGSAILKWATDKAKKTSPTFLHNNSVLDGELAKMIQGLGLQHELKSYIHNQNDVRSRHRYDDPYKKQEKDYTKAETKVGSPQMGALLEKANEVITNYKKTSGYYDKSAAFKKNDQNENPDLDPVIEFLRALKTGIQSYSTDDSTISLKQYEELSKNARRDISNRHKDASLDKKLFTYGAALYREIQNLNNVGSSVA